MKHQDKFKKKYGIDAIDFVEKADLEYFGIAKTLGIQSILKSYAEKKGINIELNDEFYKDLVEAFAEAGKKFPYNEKIKFDRGYKLEPTPVNPSIPKSKGVLEDFKDIVGDDPFSAREQFNGVYVSDDGFLYATDAHKLIKYKNNDYSEYKGKLINLQTFIASKGKKIDFIDARHPQYESVIPKNNELVKGLPTYNFYNVSKSVIALKKLQDSEVFSIIFDFKSVKFGFNPILMNDVLHFALCKGFDTFDLEYSTPNRAILFKFKDDSLGLLMPILISEDSMIGTTDFTIEKVVSDYGYSKQMPKAKLTKTVKTQLETEKEVPYKKFDGDINQTKYIPRRDISYLVLRSGEKLSGNDIIDGVYRVKKYATGGGVEESNNNFQEINGNNYFTYNFENKGNKWTVLIAWGKYNHVNVIKKTNNPFGSRLGNEFDTLQEAVDNYKDVNIKSNILFAANMAKEYGYEPKYEKGGGIYSGVERASIYDEDFGMDRVGNFFIVPEMSREKVKEGNRYNVTNREGSILYRASTKDEAIDWADSRHFENGGGVESSSKGNFYIVMDNGNKEWYKESKSFNVPNVYYLSDSSWLGEGQPVVHRDNALRPLYKANGKLADKIVEYSGMDFYDIQKSNKMARGGNVENENAEMVKSYNKQIAHHTEEMTEAMNKNGEVPAWVVAKMTRSASDLSDATHYMEGKGEEYADGGGVGETYQESKWLTKEQWEKWRDYVKTGKIDGKNEKNIFAVARWVGAPVAKINAYEIEQRAKKYGNKYAKGGGVGDSDYPSRFNNFIKQLEKLSNETGIAIQGAGCVYSNNSHQISYSNDWTSGDILPDGWKIRYSEDAPKNYYKFIDELENISNKNGVEVQIVGGVYFNEKNVVYDKDWTSHDLQYESESYANGGGVDDFKIGDWVKEKKGNARGKIWETMGPLVKLEDAYGNKSNQYYRADRLKHSSKPKQYKVEYANGGDVNEYNWKNTKYGTLLYSNNKYQGVSINKTEDGNYLVTADDGYSFYKDFEPTYTETMAQAKQYAIKEISYSLNGTYAKGGNIGLLDLVRIKSLNKNGLVQDRYRDNKWWVSIDYGKPYEKLEIIDESDLEVVKGNETRLFAKGGGIGFIPMDMEEDLMLIGKWGGITIKQVIGLLNAMIDSGVTDEDLVPKPTKNTAFQREKAIESKIKEIWTRIQPNYKGDLIGNLYYSSLKELIGRNSLYKDLLKKYKPFRKNQQFANGGGVLNYDFLVGKWVAMYVMGVKEPTYYTIKSVKVTPEQYTHRDLIISFDLMTEERIPLSKVDSFLDGQQVELRDSSGEYYVLELQKEYANGGGVGEFEYQEDKIIMNDDTKDSILDDEELQEFITPKSFVRNKSGQIVLWVDWMDYDQFDKLANFLGIKYAKGGTTPAQKRKIGKVMHEFKEGTLHSGKSDKVVKNPKQAVAIALSEAGLSKKEKGGIIGWKSKMKNWK